VVDEACHLVTLSVETRSSSFPWMAIEAPVDTRAVVIAQAMANGIENEIAE
ncbi:unnamed protein product, partial [Durusdinium trenchii]